MPEQKQVTFKLNDRELTVAPGTLVIEAARRAGVEVPSFCYFPGLALQAACRMCLVEVEKMPKMQTACTLVATEGMVVRSDTPQIHVARKGMLEFLLANHPLDCPVCDKGGECELQDMVFRYGAETSRFIEEKLPRSGRKMVRGRLLRRAPLHPLLPLRARMRRGHGRESPGRRIARRQLRHYSQRGKSPGLRRVRDVYRYLPGGRAHQRHLSLQNAALGNELRAHHLRALFEWL